MLLNCGAGKTFESPLDCKEIRPVNPKGNQPWIFIARTDSETEVPIFWPPDANSQLIGKDPHAGKDWRQEEKEMTEDQMVGWHHHPDGHEFQHTLGDGEGKERLTCCSPGVTKTQTQLSNWTTTATDRHRLFQSLLQSWNEYVSTYSVSASIPVGHILRSGISKIKGTCIYNFERYCRLLFTGLHQSLSHHWYLMWMTVHSFTHAMH